MGRFKIKRDKSNVVGKEVVGFFAYRLITEVCCDGDACIIAGSLEAMREHLKIAFGGDENHTIKKTSFEEIMRGMKLGAAYSFDKEAFGRFRAIASKTGIEVGDHSSSSETEMKFVRVQLVGGK